MAQAADRVAAVAAVLGNRVRDPRVSELKQECPRATPEQHGQLSIDLEGNTVGTGDIRAQTRQVLENIKALVQAAGDTLYAFVLNQ